MRRRHLLRGALAFSVAGCHTSRDTGLARSCLPPSPPAWLAGHGVVQEALDGLRAHRLWDSHVHLLGTGDAASGIWVNPTLRSLLHPLEFVRYRYFLNASCAEPGRVDESYVARLLDLANGLPAGSRLILLAFDYSHDQYGRRRPEWSAFHVPDRYAALTAATRPETLGWAASIHPHREDSLEALAWAISHGALAVKWLPSAMAIDPASKLCDRFYHALSSAGLPLLVHSGAERAVHGAGDAEFNNPLRLRRPLEQGVRVIVAHCASLGESADIDVSPDGPKRKNIEFFARLMDEPRFEGLLFGEISAITQRNRFGLSLETVITRHDWHHRLINGSDYPIPAVKPLFSMDSMVARKYLPETEARVLDQLRVYNPLLFDLVLKRRIRVGNHQFDRAVFESRRLFDPRKRA
ncbi:MAG: amidohydrolase family protein [Gammaproteobacteria bacterium]|nr:amidohydrolase family protein [Gammaproteobacteria bacterium]